MIFSKKLKKIAKNNKKQSKFSKNVQKIKENIKLQNEISKLKDEWNEVLAQTETFNKMKLSLTLKFIKQQSYGWSSRIYAPYAIPLETLEKLIPFIESGLRCKFIYDIPIHKQFATCKIIYPNKVKINEMSFTPVKVKAYEFCPGFDESGEPIKFNISDTPQIFIAGMQRKGKNGASDTAIVNWIYSCDEKDITFYMFQGAKNDLSKYKNCKQVYCYTEKIDEMIIALEHILEEMNRRKNLFIDMISKANGNDNIFHYNKLHLSNKLPYVIIAIDEFISLMPDEKIDGKEITTKKNLIMKYLQNIAQWGGTYGINFLILHQKPEKALCPTFLKNMASIRICFGFEDLTCCAIVLGDSLAKFSHKLPPRKAYYSNNEQNGYIYTKNLKGQIIKYIKSSIQENHRTLFKDLKKLKNDNLKIQNSNDNNKEQGIIIDKNKGFVLLPNVQKIKDTKIVVPIFDKVDPNIINNKQIQLQQNIKNIPNFIPYNPNERNLNIIDKTDILNIPTQKPIKKGDD